MTVKALNASSLLLAHQAEFEDDMSTAPSPEVWDELCMDTNLTGPHLAAQASGRAMALHNGGARESKVAKPVQTLSEGENALPRCPCRLKRFIWTSSGHHGELLHRKEGGSTPTMSPQESVIPSCHCTLPDVCSSWFNQPTTSSNISHSHTLSWLDRPRANHQMKKAFTSSSAQGDQMAPPATLDTKEKRHAT